MNTPTIPQIADMIRHHIATDNSAMKQIVDHIAPLLGIHVDTPKELAEIGESTDRLDDLADDLDTLQRGLKRGIKAVVSKLEGIHTDLSETEDMEDEASDLLGRISDVEELLEYADELAEKVEGLRK